MYKQLDSLFIENVYITRMHKFFSGILSLLFVPSFFACLLVFHVIQVVCRRIFGKNAHQISVNYLNYFLLKCINLVGNTTFYKCNYELPKNAPMLIVANHQSMFDICMISWFMRELAPKFISKIELGKGIPSISYNLRYGGSVLIDRNNKRQSLPAISNFGKRLEQNDEIGVIFPEGTRSRDGKLKEFSATGVKILTRNMPNGYIIPVTLNNSWKLMKYGNFPLGGFNKVSLEVHEPLKISDYTFETILEKTESVIKEAIK